MNDEKVGGKTMLYYRLKKRKNLYGEYVIRAFQNCVVPVTVIDPRPRPVEEANYYTDDWDDAVGTLKAIAEREHLKIQEPSQNSFIAF